MYRAPHKCFICDNKLTITTLSCDSCGTRIEGQFEGCRFCSLDDTQYEFLTVFIRNRGSIKDVEKELGVSYPTVRSALDNLISSLDLSREDSRQVSRPQSRISAEKSSNSPARIKILDLLSHNKIPAEDAAELLKLL